MVRSSALWSEKHLDKDGNQATIQAACFSPDGEVLVIAVGKKVALYDPGEGALKHTLSGHKENVYCVAFCRDGLRFASGGADKTIFIWSLHEKHATALVKYHHPDSIQCLAWNPVAHCLLSGTEAQYGIWSEQQKAVSKHKVNSRVLCCGWTPDGQHFALGHYDGRVSIRDKNGTSKAVVTRRAPVWCLQWNPQREDGKDVLAIGCWDHTLSFYYVSGMQRGGDHVLGYDPCCISYFDNGHFLCIGGSDNQATLWTKNGVRLNTIATRESWVWTCVPRPKENHVAVGCHDGSLAMFKLTFSTVHALYMNLYAFRQNMTETVIQDLITDARFTISCNEMIKKIAIFKHRVAVQLPGHVQVYTIRREENGTVFKCKLVKTISQPLNCNLLVVTVNFIILCLDKRLHMYDFNGVKLREWVLEAAIRYIKVVGGPLDRECLLVGLRNGQIFKIFVDNPFPMLVLKHMCSIRCLDVSLGRSKIAVVDENSTCLVYDLKSKELLFQENNANSVAWNTECEDMLCFTGNGMLSIKTGEFPVDQQRLQGFVVGFNGSKIFCLHSVSMKTIDVPQTTSMHRFIETKVFEKAYSIACLGVTENDWRDLGREALLNLQFSIARSAFIRIRDVHFLDLISELEKRKGHTEECILLAEVSTYMGRYREAAQLFVKGGHGERAVEMFKDLRMWEEAQEFAGLVETVDTKELVRDRAQWAAETNDYEEAVDKYLAAGETIRAINILNETGWMERLAGVMRGLNKLEVRALELCASIFSKNDHYDYARETFLKLNNIAGLMKLFVDACKWEEAFRLLEKHPELAGQVYLPYANWLAVNDRFDEALIAYQKARCPRESERMIRMLMANAVTIGAYRDAARYHWCLAKEQGLSSAPEVEFHEMERAAEMYYAYSILHDAAVEPFSVASSTVLFQVAFFLAARIGTGVPPPGMSARVIYHTLAKRATELGAYNLARYAYKRLQTLVIPREFQKEIDQGALSVRGKPAADAEKSMPCCWRCNFKSPFVPGKEDQCSNCHERFIRCFRSFSVLPLVEFVLEKNLSDTEALNLLRRVPPVHSQSQVHHKARAFKEEENFLEIGDDASSLNNLGLLQTAASRLVLGADDLLSMEERDVITVQPLAPTLPTRYFRLGDQSPAVSVCRSCAHFFVTEELEEVSLQNGGFCPFCRAPPDEE